jgi:glycosyltransferase involved in cell wall biosynthesis
MSDSGIPKLTIVVCTYNAAALLAGCFDSIRSQKTAGVHLLIMDGGSSDGTLDEVQRHADIVDRWVSKTDNGVYDAMNAAMNIVCSEWVLFLGADDRLIPGVLPRLLKAVDGVSPRNTVLYGDVYRPAGNTLYDGEFTKYKILRRNICQQAILYPVEQLRAEGFQSHFKINADHVKNIRLFFDDRMAMRYLPMCIAYFEDISDGLSRDRCDDGFIAYRRRLARKLGGTLPFLFCCLIDTKESLRKSVRTVAGLVLNKAAARS